MFFRLSIVTLMLALVAFGTPVKRDSETVVWDIDNLTTATKSLEVAIDALPNGGSFSHVMSIQTAAMNCETLINTATTDTTKSSMFTDDQANAINSALGLMVSTVHGVSDALIKQKPAIINNGALSWAQEDVKTLYSGSEKFWSALEGKCPESAQSQMMTYMNMAKAAFNAAMEAYDVPM